MNALKAHRKYISEQEAKALEQIRREESEKLAAMTPEERRRYQARQKLMLQSLAQAAVLSGAIGAMGGSYKIP